MTYIYYLAALGAAFCWASASMLARYPVKEIGEFAFIRIRMVISFLFLALICFFSGRFSNINFQQIDLIVLSGLIGIFFGDSFLFACLRRIGPRRTQLLFSFHAPFTAILGFFFYSETWSGKSLVGSILICFGVFIAISSRYESAEKTIPLYKETVELGIIGKLNNTKKNLQFVGLGLAAALCQAVGVLLLKPIFQTGDGDPILVSTLRIGVATLALISIRVSARFKAWKKLNFRLLLQIALNGTVAMVIGMTLLVFALVGGNIGIVATLAATAPILILPMLWVIDKKMPNVTAWLGAVFAVMGCFFIFN